MTVFKLPDLGEGLSEAEVLRWHVQVGEHIEVDAPMLSVETAKAVVEVPSPVSGIITALHAAPGDRIEIGAPLVEFTPDEPLEAAPETAADAGTVVGYMVAEQPEHSEAPASGSAPRPAHAAGSGAHPRAAPATRALARSLGVDLASLPGRGRDGLITLDEVLAAGLPREARGQVSAPLPGAPPELHGITAPLRGLRRAMAEGMTLAREHVAHCTVFDDADLHRWRSGGDYSTRVLRGLAAAARAEPGLNAWYDGSTESRTQFPHLDVGIAVDTSEGLLVAVMRHVEQRGEQELRAELDRLKRGARERTLKPEELRHFTFMLSNFGTMAGRYATPLVVPPAVAILGTGRVRQDVIAVEGRVEIHARMPLSLSFDHRVITGGEAVRFLAALIADLEQPA
jgi:pyruvate dehydrogenase E2 component (dihydrolipoamide acetyltransferase)